MRYDEIHFVIDQHAEVDFYSASSLKQQSAGRHVAPLGHIILIPSQPIFDFSRVHLARAGIELIGSYISNYHTITTTMTPIIVLSE
jgi:hypothetical protein